MITPSRLTSILRRGLDDLRAIREVVETGRDQQQQASAQLVRLRKQQARTEKQLVEVTSQLQQLRQHVTVEHNLTRRELYTARNTLALQHEVVATNHAAFGPYRDAYLGRDVVVLASGPSLTHYEPIPGALHIGVNSLINQSRIPLDFYFAHDFGGKGGRPSIVAQFDEGKVPQGCRLFFGLKASMPNGGIEASQSLAARVGATRYFVSPSPSRIIHSDIRFHPLADFFTITFAALHFALFTNPARLHLVGCDASFFGHFDGSPQPEAEEQVRTFLAHRLTGYRRMRDFARTFYPETEIVSHNPVNLAGMFVDEHTPGATYRTSDHQPSLAAADFADEAIASFVEQHIDEIKRGAHFPMVVP